MCLLGAAEGSARAHLRQVPMEIRQALLDEVAGAADAGVIRATPVALLRSLVRASMAGTFVPDQAIAWRAKCEARAAAKAVAAAQAERRAALDSPEAREASERARRAAMDRLRRVRDQLSPVAIRTG